MTPTPEGDLQEINDRETPPLLVYLSMGWGIQSWTLAAMIALGELPPIDLAIHADTGHEAQGTYEHARKWTPWLEQRRAPRRHHPPREQPGRPGGLGHQQLHPDPRLLPRQTDRTARLHQPAMH